MTWYQDKALLKTYAVSGTGLTHNLYYDANDRLVYANVTGTGGWTSEYTYDQSGLQAMKTGSAWYYTDRSTRGDITAIRDSTGVVDDKIWYDAYGDTNSTGSDTTLTAKLGMDYNGRDGVVDLGGGLQWMGARVFSSAQARFTSADSMESQAGTVDGAYLYGANDPVNRVDPSGRCFWDLCIAEGICHHSGLNLCHCGSCGGG